MFKKDLKWTFLLPAVEVLQLTAGVSDLLVAWFLTQDSAVVFIYDFFSCEEPEEGFQ